MYLAFIFYSFIPLLFISSKQTYVECILTYWSTYHATFFQKIKSIFFSMNLLLSVGPSRTWFIFHTIATTDETHQPPLTVFISPVQQMLTNVSGPT